MIADAEFEKQMCEWQQKETRIANSVMWLVLALIGAMDLFVWFCFLAILLS